MRNFSKEDFKMSKSIKNTQHYYSFGKHKFKVRRCAHFTPVRAAITAAKRRPALVREAKFTTSLVDTRISTVIMARRYHKKLNIEIIRASNPHLDRSSQSN